MNRKTKAAVAGTAAALLLFSGGAGTFARWYDDKAVEMDQVTTGELKLQVGEGAWEINTPNSDDVSVPFKPAKDKIAPGDVVTYTADVTPTIVGKNLQAELVIDDSGIAGQPDVWAKAKQAGVINLGVELPDNKTVLTDADNGQVQKVKVTITFPEFNDITDPSAADRDHNATWWDQELQKQTLNFTGLKLALKQTNRGA